MKAFDRMTNFRVLSQERLKSRVFRLRIESGGIERSVIVKRLDAATARRSRLVMERWLPALGLQGVAPALLGASADRDGDNVWHVLEDLGDFALHGRRSDRDRVEAAVNLIATLHISAADHPMLAECRKEAEDLGISYFASNVRDAVRALDVLRPPRVDLGREDAARRDRLLEGLRNLLDELPLRAQALSDFGGPETLLHGDLWTTNTFVLPTPAGLQARLIDWDHAGVGPVAYDLSTFLYRFPRADRGWILDLYRTAVAQAGWRLPGEADLNGIFDTMERARYANRVIWPALAVVRENPAWAFVELEEVEGWFKVLDPVLPA